MKIQKAIERYFRHLEQIKNASENTIRNYKRSLDLLLKSIGEDSELEDLNLNKFDDFRDQIFEIRTRKR